MRVQISVHIDPISPIFLLLLSIVVFGCRVWLLVSNATFDRLRGRIACLRGSTLFCVLWSIANLKWPQRRQLFDLERTRQKARFLVFTCSPAETDFEYLVLLIELRSFISILPLSFQLEVPTIVNQSVPGQVFTKVEYSLKCASLSKGGSAKFQSKIFTKLSLAWAQARKTLS